MSERVQAAVPGGPAADGPLDDASGKVDAIEADHPAPDDRERARQLRIDLALGAFVAAVVGAVVRLWLVSERQPARWQDSADFLDVSLAGWLSLDLWAGPRTPLVPAVLKILGGDDVRFMRFQVIVAAVCWAALAVAAARVASAGAPRLIAAGSVLGLSLAAPLTMWDRSVLSESLALSTMVLLLAAVSCMVRRPTALNAVAVVVAAALWCGTRDAHAYVVVVAVVVVAAAGFAIGRRRRLLRGSLLACLVGLLVVALASIGSAAHGDRGDFPIRNVYRVRILPYPDRVAWFQGHGMPQAEIFLDGTRAPHVPDGRAPVTSVPEDDPATAEWSAWVERDGRRVFARWVLTHPGYVLTEPLKDPERAFNNAGGDRSSYAASDQRVVPGLAEIFVPSRPLALLVAAGIALRVVRPRAAPGVLFTVGAATVALALPHALLSWHGDGMETARHLTGPVIQFHVGVVLMVASLFGGAPRPETAAQPAVGDPHG
jgi:hypothetical protein